MHKSESPEIKLFAQILKKQPRYSFFDLSPDAFFHTYISADDRGIRNKIGEDWFKSEYSNNPDDFFIHVLTDPDYKKSAEESGLTWPSWLNQYINLNYIRSKVEGTEDFINYSDKHKLGELTYFAYYYFEGSRQGIAPNKEFVKFESFDGKFYEREVNEFYKKKAEQDGIQFDKVKDTVNFDFKDGYSHQAYYHYLRKGVIKGFQARTIDGFKVSQGAIDKKTKVDDQGNELPLTAAIEPGTTTTPANTENTQPSSPEANPTTTASTDTSPEANPTTTASTNTSPATNSSSGTSTSTSNGSSSSGWDGTYSVETTGSATGWDTGNGWSATGVAALKRLQLSTPDALDDVITGSGNRTQSLNPYSTYRHHDQVIGSTRKSSLLANASSRRGDRHKTTLAHTMNHQKSFRDAPVALVASGALKTTLGSSDLGWISSDQPIAAYGEHSILC